MLSPSSSVPPPASFPSNSISSGPLPDKTATEGDSSGTGAGGKGGDLRLNWMIRHAESTGNAGEVTSMPWDIPLSTAGRQQAEALAERFTTAPEVVVVSPYGRTLETAQPTLNRFPGVPVMTWPIHEFTFLAPARYSGTTQDERTIPARSYWQACDPDLRDGDGAESFRDFMLRVDTALECVSRLTESFAACFSHGYFIKGMLWRLLHPVRGVDAGAMASFRDFHRCYAVENTGIFPLLNAQGSLHISPPVRSLLRYGSEE